LLDFPEHRVESLYVGLNIPTAANLSSCYNSLPTDVAAMLLSARAYACSFRVETAALSTRKPTGRSRVTNGNELFATNEPTDGRSVASRRFRDILGQLVSDLGGSDRLSEAQRQLCRRVALMC
jgi:hypothetical protein